MASVVQRERLHLPRERLVDRGRENDTPEVYWTVPQGVRPDVVELSEGSGAFLSVFHVHGIRVRSCVQLSKDAEFWSHLI